MGEHTKEPWAWKELGGELRLVTLHQGSRVVLTRGRRHLETRGANGTLEPLEADHPNAKRIVSCVNFCAGHDLTPATEAGLTMEEVIFALRCLCKSICNSRAINDEILDQIADHLGGDVADQWQSARAVLAHFPDKGDESNA